MKKKHVLIIVESSLAYGRNVVTGLSQYVRERNHWTIHFEDRGIFEISPSIFSEWRGDGIITRTANGNLAAIIRKSKCPVVELLGDGKRNLIDIFPDENLMAQLCMEHFHNRGLKNVACYSFGKSWWIDVRRKAFARAAAEQNLNVFFYEEGFGEKESSLPVWKKNYENGLVRWIRKLPRPVGILGASDSQAVQVLQTCQRIGVKVPEEVAVLGIDNDVHLCNVLTPTLSSLDQNAIQVGYRAAELLDLKMNKLPMPPRPILITPVGVVTRQSTDITAVEDADIAYALHFIREHAPQGIQVRDVLEKVNLSKSSLNRRFHQVIGRSPKEEILRVALEHAKYLLVNTDVAISQVAAQSGFSSVNHFTVVFHRKTGQTPLVFRKNYRKFVQKSGNAER